MSDDLAERVHSGRAWADYCDALKAAGDLILDPRAGADPLDRAEGYRFLSRLVRYGFEGFLEFNDPLLPQLHCATHETIKIIHENPDNVYLGARIDGRQRYRVWGTLGTARWMSFNVHAGGFGVGGRGTAAALDARELVLGPGRSFELFLGGEKRGPNWLPLTADASSLVVRQSIADRASETRSELAIERLGREGPAASLSPEAMGRGLQMNVAFLRAITEMALSWGGELAKHPNQWWEALPAAAAIFRDPNIHFHAAWFELAPDEALVVEALPPKCDYWMFVLHNRWLESLDYRHHRVVLNSHTAQREPGGRVRLVVAARDPGHPNWLDSAGHAHGTIGVRWVGPDVVDVTPSARVAKLAELEAS